MKYFPDARTFFGHHALRHQFSVPWFHKIAEDDACQRVDAVWEALSDADAQEWATLLHRSHKQGDLLLEEAASLLSRQGVSEKLHPWKGHEGPMEEEEAATQEQPTIEPTVPHPQQSQLLTGASQELTTTPLEVSTELTITNRPTMVSFVACKHNPDTYAVLLPIGTPECPVADAFPAEVQDACRTAFSDRCGLPNVHRLGPHAWIAQIGKGPKAVYLTSYLPTRTIRLRGYSFRALSMPRFPPVRFEADFSEASDVLSFEVANDIRDTFVALGQSLPEIREETRVPGERRFVVTFSVAPGLFSFYLPIRAGHARHFVAGFRPRYLKGLCWMCKVRHKDSLCSRSQLVPYS